MKASENQKTVEMKSTKDKGSYESMVEVTKLEDPASETHENSKITKARRPKSGKSL